jgi:hypothetical protein
MLKKIVSVIAATVLTVTGFTVTQASAAPSSNQGALYKTSWELQDDPDTRGDGTVSTRTVTLSSPRSSFEVQINIAFGHDVAKSLAGHKIRVTWNQQFPAGVNWTKAYYGADPGVMQSISLTDGRGYIGDNDDWMVEGAATGVSTITIPQAASTLAAGTPMYLHLGMENPAEPLPTLGSYTIAPSLYDVTTGSPINFTGGSTGSSIDASEGFWRVSGAGAYTGSVPASAVLKQAMVTCVPASKLVEGHALTLSRFAGGVLVPKGQYEWNNVWRKGQASGSALGQINTIYTVSAADTNSTTGGIRIPVGVSVTNSGSTPMPVPSLEAIVYDSSANNAQLETTCAAATPAKPTLKLTGLRTAVLTWAKNSDDKNTSGWDHQTRYNYAIYKETDLTTPVYQGGFDGKELTDGVYKANVSFRAIKPNGSIDFANWVDLEPETNYVAKIVATGNDGVPSLESEASLPSKIAAPQIPSAPTFELTNLGRAKLSWTKIDEDSDNGYGQRTINYSYGIFKKSDLNTPVLEGRFMGWPPVTPNAQGVYSTTVDFKDSNFQPVKLLANTEYVAKMKAENQSQISSAYSAASTTVKIVGPATPNKPTLTGVRVNSMSATLVVRSSETSFAYKLVAYKSSDTTFSNPLNLSNFDRSPQSYCETPSASKLTITCTAFSPNNFAIFNAPETFVVRAIAENSGIPSSESEASNPMIGGIPGVTLGTPSEGSLAGDAKKISSNITGFIRSYGRGNGEIVDDSRGNFYSLVRSASQPAPSTATQFELRKLKADFSGVEASFGNDGKVEVSIANSKKFPANQTNSLSTTFFAGGTKLAVFATISNCNGNQCRELPYTSYVYREATLGLNFGQEVDLTQKAADFCQANAAPEMTFIYETFISGVRGFTGFDRPVGQLTCRASADNSDLSQAFIVKIAADGELTKIATLNTPSSTRNSFIGTSISENPGATGSEVAAVVLGTSAQRIFGSQGQQVSNYARSITRIAADGTVTETPNAYVVSGSPEPSVQLAPVNDGRTVYAVSTQNGQMKLMKTDVASGVFDAGSNIVLDVPGDRTRLSFPQSSVPVVDGKIAFVRSDWQIGPMSYNLSNSVSVSGELLPIDVGGSPLNFSTITPSGDMVLMYTPAVDGPITHSLVKWAEVRNTVAVPTPTVSAPQTVFSLNAGGGTFTVDGINFAETSATKKIKGFYFGSSTKLVAPLSKTATKLTVKIPAGATGSMPVSLAYGDTAIFAGQIQYVGTVKLEQPLTLMVDTTAAVTGSVDRPVSVTPGALAIPGAAIPGDALITTSPSSVCSIVEGKVRFLSNGSCTVKATKAGNAWLSEGVTSQVISVRKTDSVEAGFDPEDLPSEVLERDEAIAPVIKLASGRTDYTMTSKDNTICEITDTNMIWFKRGGQDCVITIAHPTATSVWTAVNYDWTIRVLPPAGGAGSPLLVRNDNVMVRLPGLGVRWDQKKNQVFFVTRVKWVGPVQAKMTFVDDKGTELDKTDDETHTCLSNFGILKKATLPKNGQPFIISSGAMCVGTTGESGAKLTPAEKTAQTAAYAAFKRVVARNTLAEESTNVQFTYRRELHRSSNYQLVGEKLAQRPWTAPTYAKLYYRAIDSITAKLPDGITAAVSATADGAFLPTIAFVSKRTDYTVISADSDKCAVLGDGRIWAKVVGQSCVLTVSTVTNAVWAGRSYTWTIPMVAAVGADAASAVVAPSNGLPSLAGPLALTWAQSKSTVGLRLTSRNVGLVTAKMTFTGLDNVSYTCEVKFGSSKKVSATSVFPFKTQTSPTFCSGATLTRFRALVTARKSGVGQGVIPVEISYKFQQHSPATGLLLDGQVLNTVEDKPWSASTHFKLNFRATTN